MADLAKTASATDKIAPGVSDLRNRSDIDQYINTFYTNLVKHVAGEIDNSKLAALFRDGTQKNDVEVTKTKVKGNNVAGINEDGDDLPFIQWGQGWSYNWFVYPYRIAVKHTRHLEEIENFGTIADEATELREAAERTVFYAMADVFNRGITPTNAPFLCVDGMFLIDSDRPNPVVGMPNWSNEEATTDITEDALFTAQQNAQNTLAHNGDRLRLSIMKFIIPDAYDKVAWTLRNTDGLVGTAMNDANWARGRFEYETSVDFTGNTVYYVMNSPKSNKNGLEFRWAARPGVENINFEDPDIIGKRLRFRFGIGCLDPREVWRGGQLTAL